MISDDWREEGDFDALQASVISGPPQLWLTTQSPTYLGTATPVGTRTDPLLSIRYISKNFGLVDEEVDGRHLEPNTP